MIWCTHKLNGKAIRLSQSAPESLDNNSNNSLTFKISGGAQHEPWIKVYNQVFTVWLPGFKSSKGVKTGVFTPERSSLWHNV